MSTADLLDTSEAGPRVIRGGMLRTAGYAAGSLVSVVSAAVLTQYLGPEDFGRYSAVFSLLTIVQGLTDAGTANLGVREHVLLDAGAGRRFLADLLGIRLLLVAIGVPAALGFCLLAGYESDMVLGAALGGAGLVLVAFYVTLTIPLQAALRLGWTSSLELLRQVLTTIGLVALAVAGAGLAPLLGVTVPVGIVLVAAAAALVAETAPLVPAVNRETWARVLRLTLPFATATAVGIVYAHVTVLLMSLVAEDRETGLFGAAFRVYFVLGAIPSLLVGSALPVLARAARDDRDRLGYALQRLLEVCLLAGGGFALLCAVAAPFLIDVVAGDEYAGAVPVLRVQALALLGTFVIAFGAFALLAMHRYRALLIANAAGLALSAALTLALAPGHGAQGAAVAVAAGDVVLGALYLIAIRRGPDGARLSLRVAPKVALAGGAAAGLAVVSGLPSVPAAVLAGAVYLAGIVALRAIPPEVLDALRARRGEAA